MYINFLKLSNTFNIYFTEKKKNNLWGEDSLKSFDWVGSSFTLSLLKSWIRFSASYKLLQPHWLNVSLMFKFRTSFFVVLLILKLLQITKIAWKTLLLTISIFLCSSGLAVRKFWTLSLYFPWCIVLCGILNQGEGMKNLLENVVATQKPRCVYNSIFCHSSIFVKIVWICKGSHLLSRLYFC